MTLWQPWSEAILLHLGSANFLKFYAEKLLSRGVKWFQCPPEYVRVPVRCFFSRLDVNFRRGWDFCVLLDAAAMSTLPSAIGSHRRQDGSRTAATHLQAVYCSTVT